MIRHDAVWERALVPAMCDERILEHIDLLQAEVFNTHVEVQGGQYNCPTGPR